MPQLKTVTIHDFNFIELISHEKISERISAIADAINERYADEYVTLIVILKGAVPFATALHHQLHNKVKVAYMWANSYQDFESTGEVNISGLDRLMLNDQHVIIVEDIIDTGLTMNRLSIALTKRYELKSLEVATLLYKTEKDQHKIEPAFVGFRIPPDFVVGFGMDYNELGRGLKDIYILKN